MAIRPLVRLGHPALRTPAEVLPVDQLADPDVQALIDDMFETMHAEHGVGLAAPQLGIPWQLFVYAAVEPDRPADDRTRLEALVNPGIEPVIGEMVYDWEGCLSIPDLRGLVPRHPAVRVYALDRHGQRLDFRAEGYEARIIQHEFDHLNGIVFLDRMRDLRSLAFGAEWEQFMTKDDDREDGSPAVG
jgi:peptide deformylase